MHTRSRKSLQPYKNMKPVVECPTVEMTARSTINDFDRSFHSQPSNIDALNERIQMLEAQLEMKEKEEKQKALEQKMQVLQAKLDTFNQNTSESISF